MIRRAVAADAGALADLNGRALVAAYADYVPVERMRGVLSGLASAWRDGLGAPDRETWVCADLGGFVTVGASRDGDVGAGEGELRALYVEPARLGSGVGAALHDHGLSRLAALGFARASLWAFERNARARRFYAARGWRLDARPFDPDRWGWARSVRLVHGLGVTQGRSARRSVTHDRGGAP